MANVSLQTRVSAKTRPELDIVDDTFLQKKTLPAAEAITCGAPVRMVPSSTGAGKWTNANATDETESKAWGVATRTVIAGETVTAVRRGIVDGFEVSSYDYGALLYLSDTDGRIGDVAGTMVRPIGRVVPATAVSLGTAYDRLLELDFGLSSALFDVNFHAWLNADCIDRGIWIANRPCQLVAAREVHATAGNDAGAVNLQLVKDTGTNAPGAGTDLLTNNTNAGFDMKGTANTVQVGTLTSTVADLQFAVGNRLSADFAGTVTTLAGVVVTATFLPL